MLGRRVGSIPGARVFNICVFLDICCLLSACFFLFGFHAVRKKTGGAEMRGERGGEEGREEGKKEEERKGKGTEGGREGEGSGREGRHWGLQEAIGSQGSLTTPLNT